jgi:hypothetical protein
MHCFPQYPCFAICQQSLGVLATSSTTFTVGPTYSTISNSGSTCLCTDFNIYNGQLQFTTPQEIVGSSNGGIPFSRVTLTGYPSTGNVAIRWTGANGAGTCSMTYVVSSGPGIMGVGYSAFSLWWAIVISVIVLLSICCAISLCVRCCITSQAKGGQTLRLPPTQGSAIPGANPSFVIFSGSGQQQYANSDASIPTAVAVPVANGEGEGAIPIAVEANAADAAPRATEWRTVALA